MTSQDLSNKYVDKMVDEIAPFIGTPPKKKGVSENGDPQMATLWSINSLLLKMAIYS